MLAIGVHQHHHVAAGGVDAGGQGVLLAEVARQPHIDQLGVHAGQALRHLARVVAAAVVDHDQLHRG